MFTCCLYFDLPYGLLKIQHNSLKYATILHIRTPNKMYLKTINGSALKLSLLFSYLIAQQLDKQGYINDS